MADRKKRPTVSELESILENDGQRSTRLEPDGSITSVGEPDCDQETPIDERIRTAVEAEQARWSIGPVKDPKIVRRMIEDRARAECADVAAEKILQCLTETPLDHMGEDGKPDGYTLAAIAGISNSVTAAIRQVPAPEPPDKEPSDE